MLSIRREVRVLQCVLAPRFGGAGGVVERTGVGVFDGRGRDKQTRCARFNMCKCMRVLNAIDWLQDGLLCRYQQIEFFGVKHQSRCVRTRNDVQ